MASYNDLPFPLLDVYRGEKGSVKPAILEWLSPLSLPASSWITPRSWRRSKKKSVEHVVSNYSQLRTGTDKEEPNYKFS